MTSGAWVLSANSQFASVRNSRRPNCKVLFGSRQSSAGASVANDSVGVEVHLPVVRVVAVGTYRKHRPGQREGQNLDVRRRIGEDVGNLRQIGLQQGDGPLCIHRVIELRLQVDPSVRIGREVLDDVAENLPVPDDVPYVVEGVDRGDEQADFFDRTHGATRYHKVSDFEGLQDDHENAGCKVRQQAAPSQADGDAAGGDQ